MQQDETSLLGVYAMTRSRLIQLAIVLGLLGGNGCYSETFEKEVVILPAKRFAYEIQLHSHTEGRGNPHEIFDWTKQEFQSRYSICVNSLEGKIDAADLVFTQLPECAANPSFWVNPKGFVEFWDGCLTIALEAVYNNEVSSRRPLPANGTYKIAKVLDKPLALTAPCKR
ncbi:MAG TPA: hypothetical protein VJ746_04960 [Nitrospira sp.]|nr:hypothetical protein [Nitrospira sp.]